MLEEFRRRTREFDNLFEETVWYGKVEDNANYLDVAKLRKWSLLFIAFYLMVMIASAYAVLYSISQLPIPSSFRPIWGGLVIAGSIEISWAWDEFEEYFLAAIGCTLWLRKHSKESVIS